MHGTCCRRQACGEAGLVRKLRSMKQKYEGKDLQSLVDLGREQGYLTFDQVNSFLPQEVSSPTDLRSALESFEDMDIKVRDDEAQIAAAPDGGSRGKAQGAARADPEGETREVAGASQGERQARIASSRAFAPSPGGRHSRAAPLAPGGTRCADADPALRAGDRPP